MSSDAIPATSEFTPATEAELSRFLAENASRARQPILPAGGRTALGVGYPVPDGLTVSTARLAAVSDYPARDMTITVGAGVRIEELTRLLEQERQQLPIDIPQSHRATLGGALALNVSGPRRFGYGTLRDYVIGIAAVDGQGRLFHSGGRVVKNVAGYDLCKVLIGSLGTLAVTTSVTLKLRPIPETAAILWAPIDSLEAIEQRLERLTSSAARPVIVDVLNAEAARQITSGSRLDLPADRPVLAVGVEGFEQDVRWQLDALQQELSGPGLSDSAIVQEAHAELLAALAGFHVASDDPLVFRATLRSSATVEFLRKATELSVAVQSHAGNGIVIGVLPDTVTQVQQASRIIAPLRAFAQKHGGGLTIASSPDEWKRPLSVFGASANAAALMGRIKRTLDPHNVLNPGRLGELIEL